MGLLKAFKAMKEVAAAGSEDGKAPHGMGGTMQGFANLMAGMMAPMLVTMAPERGQALPATEPAATTTGDAAALAAGEAAIAARDSAFDPGLLTTFADQVFAAVSGVWESGDPGPTRGVLTDALWDPLAAATSMGQAMRRPGGMGALAGLQTGQATLAGAHAGEWYDSAMFVFDVSLGEGISLGKGAPPEFNGPWKEDWLFQRSIQPDGDPMTLPEKCPSCGAPTAVDDGGACTRCRQLVPVCTAGWLVSRIVSHSPMMERQFHDMTARLREDPSQVQRMPEALRALLPADLRGATPPPQ